MWRRVIMLGTPGAGSDVKVVKVSRTNNEMKWESGNWQLANGIIMDG